MQERTGAPAETVRRILHKDLQMRKICAKWVPHHLTELQKWTRYETCRINLERFQQEGQAMLNHIIAVDETWARAYGPELKRQVNGVIRGHHGDARFDKIRHPRKLW